MSGTLVDPQHPDRRKATVKTVDEKTKQPAVKIPSKDKVTGLKGRQGDEGASLTEKN